MLALGLIVGGDVAGGFVRALVGMDVTGASVGSRLSQIGSQGNSK